MVDGPLQSDWIPNTVAQTPRHELELIFKRVNRCEKLTPADKELLAEAVQKLCRDVLQDDEFGAWTLSSRVDYAHRTLKYAPGLSWTIRGGPPAEAALKRMKRYVKSRDVSSRTVEEHYRSIRTVAGALTDGPRDSVPDWFDELPRTLSGEADPTPKATNIIHYEEMAEMAQTMDHARDKALIAVQWSSGGRPMSETYKLRFEDIVDRGSHFLVSFPDDSKTGSRDIRLYVGAPQLRKWLKEHPANEKDGGADPDDYLWTSLYSADDRMHYNGFARRFKVAGRQAGIDKPTTPVHFRRSRASLLAKSPVITQVDLENHFGWVRGSMMARAYIARFGNSSEIAIARHDGASVDESEQPDPISPVKCDGCGRWSPRYLDECLWCSAEIDVDHALDTDILQPSSEEDDLLTLIMDGEINARDLEGLKRLEPVIRARPELLDRLDELHTILERLDDTDDPAD